MVLLIAGVAGVAFGTLGWTQRGTGLVAPWSLPPRQLPSRCSSTGGCCSSSRSRWS